MLYISLCIFFIHKNKCIQIVIKDRAKCSIGYTHPGTWESVCDSHICLLPAQLAIVKCRVACNTQCNLVNGNSNYLVIILLPCFIFYSSLELQSFILKEMNEC